MYNVVLYEKCDAKPKQVYFGGYFYLPCTSSNKNMTTTNHMMGLFGNEIKY